jgi:glycosyltransferase involved in cell wall biosynthesis
MTLRQSEGVLPATREMDRLSERVGSGSSPRVSILLAVFNGATYLPATVASVLAQSFDSWELILVDDGSQDGSNELMKRFTDKRFVKLRQSNAGAATAISNAYAVSRGEFIALLDQDDLWDAEFLSKSVAQLDQQPALQATFSWFRLIDSSGSDLGLTSARISGCLSYESLLRDFVIGATSNVLMRRSAFEASGGIDRTFRRMYDLDLCLRIARLGDECIQCIPHDLMFYRRHPDQISADYGSLVEEWEAVYRKMRRLEPEVVSRAYPIAKSNALRYFARVAYEQRRYQAALGLMTQGYRVAPLQFLIDLRNWTTLLAALCGACLPANLHRRLETFAGYRRSGS